MPTSEGTLRDEIRQSRPFRSRGQEAVLGVLRTASLVRQRVSEVIEPFGVTIQQYNVLRILRGAGGDALPTLEIGQRMIEPSPGITRLLDRLEGKGLVTRERCASDRRQVLCRIRPAGLDLLAEMDEPIEAMESSALDRLSPNELETLIGLLDRVRAAAR
jgi:DNA-binding MarR family transcriptional regulator